MKKNGTVTVGIKAKV